MVDALFHRDRRLSLGNLAEHVTVLHIKAIARGDEQILIAIEVNVQEQRTPGPIAGVQAAELRDLGVSAVAAIQTERVPRGFRAVFRVAEREAPPFLHYVWAMPLPVGMV